MRFVTGALVKDLTGHAASEILGLARSRKKTKLWSTHLTPIVTGNLPHKTQLSNQFIMTRLRGTAPLTFCAYAAQSTQQTRAPTPFVSNLAVRTSGRPQANHR